MKLAFVKFSSAVTDPSFKGQMQAEAGPSVELSLALDEDFVEILATGRDKKTTRLLVPMSNVSYVKPVEQPAAKAPAPKPPPAEEKKTAPWEGEDEKPARASSLQPAVPFETPKAEVKPFPRYEPKKGPKK